MGISWVFIGISWEFTGIHGNFHGFWESRGDFTSPGLGEGGGGHHAAGLGFEAQHLRRGCALAGELGALEDSTGTRRRPESAEELGPLVLLEVVHKQ